MADSHPVADSNTRSDLQALVRRARTAHQMLTETFESFISVIEEAQDIIPYREDLLGVVMECRSCGKVFPERRAKESADYGYCSPKCLKKKSENV